MIPSAVTTYLARRPLPASWRITPPPAGRYRGAVVIPCLAELSTLPETLASLSRNPPELLDRFLILVVVNNRTDAPPGDREDNLAILDSLPSWQRQFGLDQLCWVDAASPGNELPAGQGVGLARRIGLDLALPRLDWGEDPLLICLDGDTTVQPDYLPAIIDHFRTASAGGAAIPFRHRPAPDPAGQTAIERYELFLRAYVLGLELAGSPWAFHTVGSAMACRASAYLRSGGMNDRLAGEDFYFLQQLQKVSGVAPLSGTTVHPSPRASHRVPFGTGRSVGDMLSHGEERLLFYRPELFSIVGKWLKCVGRGMELKGEALLQRADAIDPQLAVYLHEAGFRKAWDNLRRNNPALHRREAAFHGWMDAFRTMKLMHHLTDNGRSRIEPEQALPPLFEQAGYDPPTTLSDQLELLRSLQGC